MIAQVIAAFAVISTFAETPTSPSGEVTGFTGEYKFTASDTDSNAESVPDTSSSADHIPDDNAAPVVEIDYSSNSFYLPETGGIGVEPFYIVGGIIVVTSAALLIARFQSKK